MPTNIFLKLDYFYFIFLCLQNKCCYFKIFTVTAFHLWNALHDDNKSVDKHNRFGDEIKGLMPRACGDTVIVLLDGSAYTIRVFCICKTYQNDGKNCVLYFYLEVKCKRGHKILNFALVKTYLISPTNKLSLVQ